MVGRMELAVVLGLWIAGVGMLPSCIQPPAPRGGFLGCFLGSPSPGPYESSTALAGTWGGGDGPTAALHLGGPRRCRVGAPSAIKKCNKNPRCPPVQPAAGSGWHRWDPNNTQSLAALGVPPAAGASLLLGGSEGTPNAWWGGGPVGWGCWAAPKLALSLSRRYGHGRFLPAVRQAVPDAERLAAAHGGACRGAQLHLQ